ncbi:MAG: hypothetical protein NUW01_13530 [Gemmatimonadaceae bacterium]|nr:hypothetical protein [Gemmatimonadaceae bacterium]
MERKIMRLCVCEHSPSKHRVVGGKMMCDGCGGQDAMHKYREREEDAWLDRVSALFFLALLLAMILVGGWLWG